MNDASLKQATQDIVVEELFPHAPEIIWQALTNGALIERWLMKPTGFEPVVGNRFTYQTTPAGDWDGTIRCEVLEIVPNRRFAYAWRGGHESNIGYGAPLDTIVTWTLENVAGGTRVRMVHSGFVVPRNDSALKTMGDGWKKVLPKLETLIAQGGLN
jgi:uncharacterized protein YndB with AHSA1/START domain